MNFRKYLLAVAIIIVFLGVTVWGEITDKHLKIYFMDVGQGDSTLIRTPDRKYLLIDSGRDDRSLEQLGQVLPFWKKNLDLVILTHPDIDHIGGMDEILKYYAVSQVWFDPSNGQTGEVSDLLKVFEEKNIHNKITGQYHDLVLGCCVILNVLWPRDSIEDLQTNDSSITLEVRYGAFNAFLGGDLPIKYEDLVAIAENLDVDVLKVDHHGSKTSSSEEFLARITPEVAIISVGKNNTYGHPNEDVIDRLKERNIVTYLTQDVGTVLISTDGSVFTIVTHRP